MTTKTLEQRELRKLALLLRRASDSFRDDASESRKEGSMNTADIFEEESREAESLAVLFETAIRIEIVR